jgi:hypothetical protein
MLARGTVGRPSNVQLILQALQSLRRGTTADILVWLRSRHYDPPPPRSVAQCLEALSSTGAVLRGFSPDGAYKRWVAVPLLDSMLRELRDGRRRGKRGTRQR